MTNNDAALDLLVRAVIVGDTPTASRLIAASPAIVSRHVERGATREHATEHIHNEINHYIYGGDTALHAAAAGYRVSLVQVLITAGADVSAKNRRGAEPLHYAADGQPGSDTWHPDEQAATITVLIAAGADPNAADKSGVTPLHRAVRCRCGAAVEALLAGGAHAQQMNRSGSTPMNLATRTTGRGGSGSAEAKVQQGLIIRLLQSHDAQPEN
jgi:Ankyrin repeats (many copies)